MEATDARRIAANTDVTAGGDAAMGMKGLSRRAVLNTVALMSDCFCVDEVWILCFFWTPSAWLSRCKFQVMVEIPHQEEPQEKYHDAFVRQQNLRKPKH